MRIDFEKWHGCLNDFVVIWLSTNESQYAVSSLKRQAAQLCSKRGDGIGADGILVLETPQKRDFKPEKLTIINSDGSVAQNCGNGLRCAALSVYKRIIEEGHKSDKLESLTFQVEGREMICQFLEEGRSAGTNFPTVAVEMGIPQLNAALSWYAQAGNAVKECARELKKPELTQEFFSCDIGNPHLVFFVSEASQGLIQQVGPYLQKRGPWDGINVHVVQSSEANEEDQKEALRSIGQRVSEVQTAWVWERGVGETAACGSGACAIVASSLSTGLADRDQWMAVQMPGGRLYAKQSSPDESVLLAGPAAFVFKGMVEI